MAERGTKHTSYYVLDVTAFTKGLASIKKWVESDQYDVKLFVPKYTIHELDHLKKGHSMVARNARESIRFIDMTISNGDYDIKEEKLMLESPEDVGPGWRRCITFRKRTPKVTEFPDYQPPHSNGNGNQNPPSTITKDGEIMYEQDLPSQDEHDEEEEGISISRNGGGRHRPRIPKAELPNRYKYLLRPLIKKAHLEEGKWKFITDDPVTKIWCESFGIQCLNVIEADCHLFNKGLNSDRLDASSIVEDISKLSIEGSTQPVPRSDASSRKKFRRRNNNHKEKSQEPEVIDAPVSIIKNTEGGTVRLEKYDSISYVPRGSGELWAP